MCVERIINDENNCRWYRIWNYWKLPWLLWQRTFIRKNNGLFLWLWLYIGDFAYGKLRLKGFCNKDNSKFNKINDINNKEKYLEKECAYKCKYFLLKKVK